jgi:hypothetical protein
MGERMSIDEMVESLNGYDEIAIEKAFGSDVSSLLEKKPTMGLRALVFVDVRRGGVSDAEARKSAMELRLGEVQEYFPDEDPEVTPDDPATDAGKDDELPD